MSDFLGHETQIGDVVNISGTRRTDPNTLFEITNIDIKNNTVIIDLNKINSIAQEDARDIAQRELKLEISPNGNRFSDPAITDDSIVEFLGPIKLDPELLDGLECDTPSNLREAIKRFENFWYDPRQTELNLEYLYCTQLPPAYFSHPRIIDKLKVLNLRVNELESIPPEIGDLINLEALWLSGNKLEFIPPEIGNLVNLRRLHLDYNKLESLPLEPWNRLAVQEPDIIRKANDVGIRKSPSS